MMSSLRTTSTEFESLIAQAKREGRSASLIERLELLKSFVGGSSISLLCREKNIARTTFYRWIERFDPTDLDSLEDKPTHPPVQIRRTYVEKKASVEQPATNSCEDCFYCRMKKNLPRSVKPATFLLVLVSVLANLVFLFLAVMPQVATASSWDPGLLVNTEAFQIVDEGDGATDVYIQFGDTLAETITYDRTATRFEFSDDIHATGNISGSGTIVAEGNIETASDIAINKDNAAQDAVLTFGNDLGAETLTFSDTNNQFEFTDDLEVFGALSGATLSIAGGDITVAADGTTIINEFGSASNFRVESDDEVNMLFVDGANDYVGIGTGAPDRPLTIQGSGGASEWITFKDTAGDSEWHLNYLGDGLNFVETGVLDGRLYLEDGGNVGIGTTTPSTQLDIQNNGEVIEVGLGSATDTYINFNDGTDRFLGWDDSEDSFSTFDQQLRFRTRQGSTPPVACSATVAGMQWMDTDTGLLYICDTSNGRDKWLGVYENKATGEESNNCTAGNDPNSAPGCNVDWGHSLGTDGGTQIGMYIPHDVTLTAYGFSADNDACTSGSFDLEVWSTGSNADDNNYTFEANIATGLTGQAHNSNTLDVDVDGDQYILWGIDNNCGQTIDDFHITFYYRYRHD